MDIRGQELDPAQEEESPARAPIEPIMLSVGSDEATERRSDEGEDQRHEGTEARRHEGEEEEEQEGEEEEEADDEAVDEVEEESDEEEDEDTEVEEAQVATEDPSLSAAGVLTGGTDQPDGASFEEAPDVHPGLPSNQQPATSNAPADNSQLATGNLPEPELDDADLESLPQGHHGWTIVLISLGVCLIAACLIIPQVEQNRRLRFEAEKLRSDLAHLERQVSINGEFIQRLGSDPVLSERLAQRQLGLIRKGRAVVHIAGEEPADRSPFSLVTIPPPPPAPEFHPLGGRIGKLMADTRARLYLIGGGLLLMASGLILGSNPRAS